MTNLYSELDTVFEQSAAQDCLRLGNGDVLHYGDVRQMVARMGDFLV